MIISVIWKPVSHWQLHSRWCERGALRHASVTHTVFKLLWEFATGSSALQLSIFVVGSITYQHRASGCFFFGNMSLTLERLARGAKRVSLCFSIATRAASQNLRKCFQLVEKLNQHTRLWAHACTYTQVQSAGWCPPPAAPLAPLSLWSVDLAVNSWALLCSFPFRLVGLTSRCSSG